MHVCMSCVCHVCELSCCWYFIYFLFSFSFSFSFSLLNYSRYIDMHVCRSMYMLNHTYMLLSLSLPGYRGRGTPTLCCMHTHAPYIHVCTGARCTPKLGFVCTPKQKDASHTILHPSTAHQVFLQLQTPDFPSYQKLSCDPS